MGFLSGISSGFKSLLGGSGNSSNNVTSSQNSTINTDIEIVNDLSALAIADENALIFNKQLFEYAQQLDKATLTMEQRKQLEEKEADYLLLEAENAKIKQSEEALNLSKSNRNLTVFFAIVGAIFAIMKMRKTSKRRKS